MGQGLDGMIIRRPEGALADDVSIKVNRGGVRKQRFDLLDTGHFQITLCKLPIYDFL